MLTKLNKEHILGREDMPVNFKELNPYIACSNNQKSVTKKNTAYVRKCTNILPNNLQAKEKYHNEKFKILC